MTSCGNCRTCSCRMCAERDVERYVLGDWVDEPWSTWLPAMIKADYWPCYESRDLNKAFVCEGDSNGRTLNCQSSYSKRYFCTKCPHRGPLLPNELLADHASHKAIGVSRLWNFTGVLHSELKAFLDVSEIKQKRGDDGQSYIKLRSLVRPDRRAKSHDEITCFDCLIIKTMERRNILTTFCSLECQFSSRLSLDAAILFTLMLPEEPRQRNFHHYLDYNFARLGLDAPAQKRSKTANMVIEEDHDRLAVGLPCAALNETEDAKYQFPIVVSPGHHGGRINAIELMHLS